MISLSDVAQHLLELEIGCRRCERHEHLSLDRLVQECGGNFKIPDLLHALSGDCPKRLAGISSDLCGIYCPQLPALFLPALYTGNNTSTKFRG
jgi:hypothetical protein